MDCCALDYLTIPACDGVRSWRIARRRRLACADGKSLPGYVWLGGFASHMQGEKARFLDARAASQSRAMLRFDYSGHGESAFDAKGGRFEEGCIGDWLEQSVAMFLASTQGPQILIGSSMGAWIALLMSRRLQELGAAERLAGMALLAPAVDFTQELLWKRLPEAARREILNTGVHMRPSPYGAATPISARLIEDGRRHLLLGGPIRTHAHAHILQGVLDEDVPWRHAMTLSERLAGDKVTMTLIADGDHRLSRPGDLALIAAALERFG